MKEVCKNRKLPECTKDDEDAVGRKLKEKKEGRQKELEGRGKQGGSKYGIVERGGEQNNCLHFVLSRNRL